MSDFLKKMKESVETGEFNSEIANRLNEIDAKADEFAKDKTVDEMQAVVDKKIGDIENVGELTSEFEDQMEFNRLQNEIGIRVAHIINLDGDITNFIVTLKSKIEEVRNKYGDVEVPKFQDLFSKLSEIENKYSVIKF